jgi:hypothetical protein
MGWARWPEGEKAGEERRQPELADGDDSGEADGTITVSIQTRTG